MDFRNQNCCGDYYAVKEKDAFHPLSWLSHSSGSIECMYASFSSRIVRPGCCCSASYQRRMGGKCPHRSVKKRRYSHKTARRTKFLLMGDDAVYDELQKGAGESSLLPLDEDLPGMGQYYCLHCDRYFANTAVRDEHFKTKRHRKRVKIMLGPKPHTQLDADLAAGMGMPDNGPKLMSM